MSNIPIRDMTLTGTPSASSYLVFDDGTMRKGTLASAADAVRPVASQSEATAGADNAKVMSALRVKQSISSEIGVSLASKAQGDLASTALQGTSLAGGVLNFLLSPTSANFATALADETGSGVVVFSNSPVLVAPNLGTPSAINLTNGSGLPVGGISGLATGGATFLGTPTSANLKAFVTDETGSGALVFGTSPNITTPTGIVKADVGLGNVDNTSDATKWAATKTLTNTTFDTAGAGNFFGIGGLPASSNTGTGAVVRATSPTLTNPDVGTQSLSDNSTKAASTAYVTSKVAAATAGVASLNGQTGALTVVVSPQGRATLTSGVAVTTAGVFGATSIYYTPAGGNQVPIYLAGNMIPTSFTELTLPLDSNAAHTGYHQNGKVFDGFMVNDSGTIRIGTGPAWTSDTTRGTGAGTTELDFSKFGIPTNKNSMALRFGSASGDTITVPANQATYLFSFATVADGQTTDSKAIRYLFNAYNQTLRAVRVVDPALSWPYSTAAWRQANGSSANQISLLDGLGALTADIKSMNFVNSSTTTLRTVRAGVGLDSTAGLASGATGTIGAASSASALPIYSFFSGPIGLGKHALTWLEYGGGTDTQTWFGSDTGSANFFSGLSGNIVQ